MEEPSPTKSKHGPVSREPRQGGHRDTAQVQHLYWICAAVGVVAVGALLWLFGLTWRTGIAIAIFVACPVIVVWVLLRAGRKGPIQPETDG